MYNVLKPVLVEKDKAEAALKVWRPLGGRGVAVGAAGGPQTR